jgi:serine/threonine-protein kinase
MDLQSMPPMVPAAPGSETEAAAGSEVSGPPPAESTTRPEPAKTVEKKNPAAGPPAVVTGFAEEDLIRSAEQFLAMVQRLGREGGSLWIAAGADFELPTVRFDGMGRVQLRAQPSPRRPRLRFRPPEAAPGSPTEWTVLFHVRSTALHVQGLDIVIPDPDPMLAERSAAVSLLPGGELKMTDCTVTVMSRQPWSALFTIQPQREPPRNPAAEPVAARGSVIQLRNSFLRSGGDGVTVAGGRKLTLELDNVLAATEGSLVHSLGNPRAASLDEPAVEVRLDQVTARVKGGLVHLDSSPEEPELASLVIRAENSIVSTAAGDYPLFRLEGQGQLDQLRDKIRWEGRKVAYHRIKTYRRDEVVQTGVSPRNYDRNDWTTAFLPKDESPLLGDVQFARESDSAQAVWALTRDDFRLAPASPVAHVGAEVDRVPQAPAEDEF